MDSGCCVAAAQTVAVKPDGVVASSAAAVPLAAEDKHSVALGSVSAIGERLPNNDHLLP